MNKDPRVMEYFTKMQKIYSFTSKINFPSENVMKKIGLLKAGEFEHPNISEGNPLRRHLLYCLDAIHRGEILH
jgi:RimJ/RimL family protein N-acetyltransferase